MVLTDWFWSMHDELLKRHGTIEDSCPAKFGDMLGVLGWSSVAYYRVWFDPLGGGPSQTLDKAPLWDKEKARAAYEKWKVKIGI